MERDIVINFDHVTKRYKLYKNDTRRLLGVFSKKVKYKERIAVNVNIRPEILIVDEALSVGDREFRAKCLEKVNDIIEKDGVTLLFVTHSTGTARKFCSRGIFLVKGEVKYDGDIDTAIELYDAALARFKDMKRRAKRVNNLLGTDPQRALKELADMTAESKKPLPGTEAK